MPVPTDRYAYSVLPERVIEHALAPTEIFDEWYCNVLVPYIDAGIFQYA